MKHVVGTIVVWFLVSQLSFVAPGIQTGSQTPSIKPKTEWVKLLETVSEDDNYLGELFASKKSPVVGNTSLGTTVWVVPKDLHYEALQVLISDQTGRKLYIRYLSAIK